MPKHSARAQEIRDLAAELSAQQGGCLTLSQLQKVAAHKWYAGDVTRVRSDYVITTLMGHGTSSMTFNISNEVITVTTVMPHGRSAARISPDDFVYLAIEKLPSCVYAGAIHTALSRFNASFRLYFPDLDPVEHTKKMAAEKKIHIRPSSGGVLISREPFKKAMTLEEILAVMGITS